MDSPLPTPLRWAVRLLLVEAAAVAVVAGLLLYSDLTGETRNLRAALAVTGYALLIAVALAVLGLGLARRRRWTRAPAIALQLLLLPVAFALTRGGLIWLGLPTAAMSITVIALLVAPATREALGIR